MSLTHLMPPAPRPNCRNCDMQPRVKGALYCELCLDDIMALTRMAVRRRHPAECFCVDCMCVQQRQFRHNQVLARRVQASQPTPPPEPFSPRRA